jgi:hypothetical protein
MESLVRQTDVYDEASTFTQMSAATVAASKTAAPPVSVRKNARSGVSRLRAQAVRPESAGPLSRLPALLTRVGRQSRAGLSGNLGSSPRKASTSTVATARFRNQFRSAGITYHGACSVEVALIASS